MASAKSVTGLIVFAKNESVYNAGPASALTGSTDAIQTILEHPVFDIKYSYDGNRNGASYSAGNYRRALTKGRMTEGAVKIEGKGAAATYTLSVTPPNLHPFILASGMSGSLQGASWIYKPQPLGSTPKSLAMNVYSRGELTPVSGAYCSMKIDGSSPGPAVFEFTVKGIAQIPTALASPPARVWIGSGTLPPNNTDITMLLGSFSPIVRSWTYDDGLEIVDRVNLNNQDANAGKAIGRRKPMLKVQIEAPLLSDFDAYTVQSAATITAISFTVGSVANNKFTISMPYCNLTEVAQTADGPVALLDLTFEGSITDASADDDLVLTFA